MPRPRRDDFVLADWRFAEVLRLLGTTRSSSLTEKPAEDFARGGPSKLGSMRLSLRFAMRCAVCPDACRIGPKIGIDFRKSRCEASKS
ncbi:hypothetical protein MES5069_210023 [Mesorhizobium escarrei]|uniref:Short-chain fatty acyl coenzyme A regulators C-terminal domain-containing protein n=1 Tax=Mesorhizobium escarrei TaxID=666018 RepID=A0ABM9DQH7_9HYPH|nr:hypothetical protein MES5069_210023 [Mesorhizobium escarrei]